MKNQDIERLRGIAILLVLFQHLSITPVIFEKLNLNSKNLPFYLGVELFFLISGYVVTKSFVSKQGSLKLFYFKRIFRIFPLIIFFIFFTSILNSFKHYFTVTWDIFNSDALAILGAYFINSVKHNIYYNQAMWSLSVEMQFYIFFPVILLILTKINHLNNKSLIAILSLIYILIAGLLRYIMVYVDYIKIDGFLYHIAFWKFDFLILGILLYFIELHINKEVYIKKLGDIEKEIRINIVFKVLSFILIALPCFISYKFGAILSSYKDAPQLNTIGLILFGICFFMLLLIASQDKNLLTIHPKVDKIIEYLGARSYSIYVLHFPIFVIVWMVINKFVSFIFYIDPIYYGISQLLLFIIIGIPIIEIVFYFIEKPGIRLGNLLIQKYKIEN